MATSATPYGARPIGTLSASGSYTGSVRHLPIITTYGTAIFNGDFVKVAADGTIAKDTGTATLTTCGIFMGCSYTDPTSGQKTFSTQWPASNAATDAMAYVLDDPMVVFQMQGDDGTGLYNTDRGLNAAVVQTAGSTSIGKSKNTLDRSSTATTDTLPLRILDFVDGPDSKAPVGTTVSDAYPDVIVKFNAAKDTNECPHQYMTATGV
jgi:hypothetical protein